MSHVDEPRRWPFGLLIRTGGTWTAEEVFSVLGVEHLRLNGSEGGAQVYVVDDGEWLHVYSMCWLPNYLYSAGCALQIGELIERFDVFDYLIDDTSPTYSYRLYRHGAVVRSLWLDEVPAYSGRLMLEEDVGERLPGEPVGNAAYPPRDLPSVLRAITQHLGAESDPPPATIRMYRGREPDLPRRLDQERARSVAGLSPLRAALSRHGFPTAPGPGLTFDAEGERLLNRGFPEMRLLTDEVVPAEVAIERAHAGLRHDMFSSLWIPRDVARRYLLGFGAKPGRLPLREQAPSELDLVRSEAEVTTSMLETALHLRPTSELTFGWLYLYEAFLGTELVARALVDYLLTVAGAVSADGSSAATQRLLHFYPALGLRLQPPDARSLRTALATSVARLPIAFTWLALRLEPEVAVDLRAKLAGAPSAHPLETHALFALLRWAADPADLASPADSAEDRALVAGSTAPLAALQAATPYPFHDAAHLARRVGTAGLENAFWLGAIPNLRAVERLSLLRDPAAVRVMARAVRLSDDARAFASGWLRRHAPYARPILEDLRALENPVERESAAAALALF